MGDKTKIIEEGDVKCTKMRNRTIRLYITHSNSSTPPLLVHYELFIIAAVVKLLEVQLGVTAPGGGEAALRPLALPRPLAQVHREEVVRQQALLRELLALRTLHPGGDLCSRHVVGPVGA